MSFPWPRPESNAKRSWLWWVMAKRTTKARTENKWILTWAIDQQLRGKQCLTLLKRYTTVLLRTDLIGSLCQHLAIKPLSSIEQDRVLGGTSLNGCFTPCKERQGAEVEWLCISVELLTLVVGSIVFPGLSCTMFSEMQPKQVSAGGRCVRVSVTEPGIQKWNFLYFSLSLLPLVLSVGTTEKGLASSSSFFCNRYLYTWINPSKPSTLRAEQSQICQLFFIRKVLPSLNHFCGFSLDLPQEAHIFLVLGSQECT